MTDPSTLPTALVVSAHGRHVLIELPDGSRRIAHPRAKRNQAVVGDTVHWSPSADAARIEAIAPRRNLFFRQDHVRTKSFAANIDQLLILLAAEPEFSERLLARALIAAEAQGIPALIGLNKPDLHAAFDAAWRRLEPYAAMGYPILRLGLAPLQAPTLPPLQERLHGRRTLVLGPSGVGKSTLINTLVPHARAQTNAISAALGSGRHTTTHTQLYWLDPTRQSALLDSPGFQEFGLHHIQPQTLAHWMPDLRAHLGQCKFPNCTHRHEPGCAILSLVKKGSGASPISESRYQIYEQLYDELSRAHAWA